MVRMKALVGVSALLLLAAAQGARSIPAPMRNSPHIDVVLESGCPVDVSMKNKGNDPAARYCKGRTNGPLLSDAYCVREVAKEPILHWIEAEGGGQPSSQCFTVEMVVDVDDRPVVLTSTPGWMNENQKRGPWAGIELPSDIDPGPYKYTIRSGCTDGPAPIYDCEFDPRILVSGDGDPGKLGDQ